MTGKDRCPQTQANRNGCVYVCAHFPLKISDSVLESKEDQSQNIIALQSLKQNRV